MIQATRWMSISTRSALYLFPACRQMSNNVNFICFFAHIKVIVNFRFLWRHMETVPGSFVVKTHLRLFRLRKRRPQISTETGQNLPDCARCLCDIPTQMSRTGCDWPVAWGEVWLGLANDDAARVRQVEYEESVEIIEGEILSFIRALQVQKRSSIPPPFSYHQWARILSINSSCRPTWAKSKRRPRLRSTRRVCRVASNGGTRRPITGIIHSHGQWR